MHHCGSRAYRQSADDKPRQLGRCKGNRPCVWPLGQRQCRTAGQQLVARRRRPGLAMNLLLASVASCHEAHENRKGCIQRTGCSPCFYLEKRFLRLEKRFLCLEKFFLRLRLGSGGLLQGKGEDHGEAHQRNEEWQCEVAHGVGHDAHEQESAAAHGRHHQDGGRTLG